MKSTLITISNQKEISRIFDSGQTRVNRCFVIRAIYTGFDQARFVFTVGKRYGNAVQRNRIKRQCREILRQNLDIIPVGFDYAIIPRIPCKDLDYRGIKGYLLAAIKEIGS